MQIAADWLGVVIIGVAIAAQIFNSLRRGKVEPDEPEPTRPPRAGSPAPVEKPKPTSELSRSLEELMESLGKTPEPESPPKAPPVVTRPVPINPVKLPPPVSSRAPVPPFVVKTPSPSPSYAPDPLAVATEKPLFATRIEKLAISPTEVAAPAATENYGVTRFDTSTESTAKNHDFHQSLRERLHHRDELQRAIVLNEILSPALGLRDFSAR